MAPVKGPSILHLFASHRLLHIVVMIVMMALLHMVMMVAMLVLHSLGIRRRNRQSKRDSGQCGQNESNLLHLFIPQVRRF